MNLSKYRYYLSSIPTLLGGFADPRTILAVFLGIPGSLPTEVRLRRSGWRFSVRSAMDVWIIKETCLDNGYLLPTEADPFWTVIDVGAGLGDFTVLAAAVFPEGEIHAYEPLEESFELLRRNLAANKLDDVLCFQEAAGIAGRRAAPLESTSEPVSTSFIEGDDRSPVRMVDLSEMISRISKSECDLLKVDCEGCEFDFLLESDPADLDRVHRITMEVHDGYSGRSTEELVAHLRQSGYKVRKKVNPVHSYLSHIYATRHR